MTDGPASRLMSPRPTPAAGPPRPPGTPRVTVGMPVYNGAKALGRSIESMLEQTFSDLELVISDNASTDESFEIAQEYARQDERVRVVRSAANVGVNMNYSRLVGHARGEYFKWASSNDLCHRTFIEKCVRVLDARADVGLCHPRTRLFVDSPEAGREYERGLETLDEDSVARFRYVLERGGLNNAINGVIRTALLRRTALMRRYRSSDVTLLAEIALRGKIVELPEVLFFRRFDAESATSLQDALTVRRYHFPTPSLGMFFQTWRRCWGNVSAVSRADLGLSQRWRGLSYAARTWYWALPALYADVGEAAAALARRHRRSDE